MILSKIVEVKLLLLLSFVVLTGWNDAHAGDEQLMEHLGIEKKYYLKDCIVKLNFLWGPSVNQSVKQKVLQDVMDPIVEAMVSGEFPYFSAGTTRAEDYYVFYFLDQCENRQGHVRKLVEEKFLPNIPDFPKYEIEDEGIKPGFDGTTPTCCWLDY